VVAGAGGRGGRWQRRIREDLLRYGVQLEEYGGDVQIIEVSALKVRPLSPIHSRTHTQAHTPAAFVRLRRPIILGAPLYVCASAWSRMGN
jgi:hypothetical protein